MSRGQEVGAAVAVYQDGRKVVDLWGGFPNGITQAPWEQDTLVTVFSTTKGVASLAVAVAASRGLIAYDTRVADYWPDFAQAGKDDGPDPERRSLCHCKNCQLQTVSALAIQARFPREQVTIEGKSTALKFPIDGAKPVTYRSCDSEGATYHFCPECGSTVYYELAVAPEFIGVRVGAFTDPTFPPPMISGFEEYRFPWAMNVADLPMPGGIMTSGGLTRGVSLVLGSATTHSPPTK